MPTIPNHNLAYDDFVSNPTLDLVGGSYVIEPDLPFSLRVRCVAAPYVASEEDDEDDEDGYDPNSGGRMYLHQNKFRDALITLLGRQRGVEVLFAALELMKLREFRDKHE